MNSAGSFAESCSMSEAGAGEANGQASFGGVSMADAREVMNIRQASQYLGISADTLYKYVSEETIPAFKLGNRWKFKKSILDSWMEDRSLSSESQRPRKGIKAVRASAGAD
jgi:excisionase family DNA binding protein